MILSVFLAIPKTLFPLRRRGDFACALFQDDAVFRSFFVGFSQALFREHFFIDFGAFYRFWYQNGLQKDVPREGRKPFFP